MQQLPSCPGQARLPSRARAFTLIELLVVIAIISVLAAILFPTIGAINDRAAKAHTKSLFARLADGIAQYKTDVGRLPSFRHGEPMNAEEQQRCLFLLLNGDPSDGHGGRHEYLSLKSDEIVGGRNGEVGAGAPAEAGTPLGAIVDGWGNGVHYLELHSIPSSRQPAGVRNPRTYDLVSAGPDRMLGTEDDCYF